MTFGFIGSGHIGQAVAECAIRLGYDVVMSNSRSPDTLKAVVAKLGPKAKAAWNKDVAKQSDVIVVCPPLFALSKLPTAGTEGKIIIDTMNYYPSRDGNIKELDEKRTTTSEMTQKHFPKAYVVKAFNCIPAFAIPTDNYPAGDPDRRALPIAGDDAKAKAFVKEFMDKIGFDVLDAGPLKEGFRFENGTPAYVRRVGLKELEKLVESLPERA